MQVREYGCPVMAKVEGVNWTFAGGRIAGEAMQNLHQISHAYIENKYEALNAGVYHPKQRV